MPCVQVKPSHHALNRPSPSISPRRPNASPAKTGFNLPKNETNRAGHETIPDKNEAIFVKNEASCLKTEVVFAGKQTNVAATEVNEARTSSKLARNHANDVRLGLSLCKAGPAPTHPDSHPARHDANAVMGSLTPSPVARASARGLPQIPCIVLRTK